MVWVRLDAQRSSFQSLLCVCVVVVERAVIIKSGYFAVILRRRSVLLTVTGLSIPSYCFPVSPTFDLQSLLPDAVMSQLTDSMSVPR